MVELRSFVDQERKPSTAPAPPPAQCGSRPGLRRDLLVHLGRLDTVRMRPESKPKPHTIQSGRCLL